MAPLSKRNTVVLLLTVAAPLASIVLFGWLVPSHAHLIAEGGRMARILTGCFILVAATLGYPYRLPDGSRGAVTTQILITILGIFVLFEGIRGWCALRALGIHTPF